MPTTDEVHYGFKKITLANWLEPDLSKIFTLITQESWIAELQKHQLDPKVPTAIQALFESTRAMFIYGYLFYPLITLASQQLDRVAEAALAAKCTALNLPAFKPTKPGKKRKPGEKPQAFRFVDNIARLVDAGALSAKDKPWWEKCRKRRNQGSHPDSQTLHAPGYLLGFLQETTEHINKLFA